MAVKRFPFKAIQIFQPPTLIRQQELIRTSEKIGIKIFRWLNFFLYTKISKAVTSQYSCRVYG